MKIVLNGWEDVKDHVALLSPALLVEWNAGLQAYLQDRLSSKPSGDDHRQRDIDGIRQQQASGHISAATAQAELAKRGAEDQWAKAHFGHDVHPEGYQGLPADIAQPETPEPGDADLPNAADDPAQLDLDGVAHTTDWHSDPPKINADGRWKARRKRDADAYAAWLEGEQLYRAAVTAIADEAEPVVTETHALPQDEVSEGEFRAAASRETASAESNALAEQLIKDAHALLNVDPDKVLRAALEIAGDQPDGHTELLAACKAFMTAHSHAAFNDLKAAVAPDGSPGGKSLLNFSPAERRLMQAVLAVYPKPE